MSKSELQKTLEREHYGFVLYLSSFAIFILYLFWSLTPDNVLRSLGITYYPSRYWAIVLPIWVSGLIPFAILVHTSLNMINTPSFDDFDLLTDDYSNTELTEKDIKKILEDDAIPDLQDVPLNIVNQCWRIGDSTNFTQAAM